MRLWLSQDERRPSPPPVATNDAIALSVGCAAWLVALVALLIATAVGVEISVEVLSTVIIGLVLGTIGLYYLRTRG
ncbi:DUF2530 domain-containing protein [Microbacteriaceae bacterium VKM Ac-2855]|nr:DUF2530 domain-containing protein [Microbacteriaceae bacterium VKM Ac-2855]